MTVIEYFYHVGRQSYLIIVNIGNNWAIRNRYYTNKVHLRGLHKITRAGGFRLYSRDF